MVEQVSFLGMKLKTQRQRRLLVIAYYSMLLLAAAAGLARTGHVRVVSLFNFAFWMCLILGGIYGRGPVKSYTRPVLPLDLDHTGFPWDQRDDEVLALGLNGPRPHRDATSTANWEPLDEREQTERDHAHYEAYRILRWTLGIAVLAYWLSLHWIYPWLNAKLPVLAMIALVYVLSLPQAILLWTEPAPVDAA